MSTNIGSTDQDTKVKKVLSLLNPTHYQSDMWDIALTMNLDELELLKRYGQELQFIVQYVYDNPRKIT